MSWQKITLPYTTEIDPDVVEIGRLAQVVYLKENMPLGFAMLHAARGPERGRDKRLVYLSPVAAELCTDIAERYTLEPCDVPACDEPDVAFVFGDPLVKNELKEFWEPEPEPVTVQDESQAESESASA